MLSHNCTDMDFSRRGDVPFPLKRLNEVWSPKEPEGAAILRPPVVVFSGHSAKIVDVVFGGEEAQRIGPDQHVH